MKKEAAPGPRKNPLFKNKRKSGKKRDARQRETTSELSSLTTNEWHNCIQRKDWEGLRHLLAELHENGKNKEKRGKSPSGQKRSSSKKSSHAGKNKSISWLWKGSAAASDEDPRCAEIASESLRITNAEGRTPLHMALNEPETPDSLLVELLKAQPKCVSVPDAKGRLPLQFAVVRQKKIDFIGDLVDMYPQALSHEDERGRTPIFYAIDVAKRRTDLDDAPISFWASQAKGSLGQKWQENQIELWELPRWLLMASASHRETHLAVSDEQPLLIEALLHAAPPTVISLLISASSTLLQKGDQSISLCCSAMYLCIFRQYPVFVLRRLGALCPKDVRFVRDETGLGLISAHYVNNCFEKSKLMEYVAAEDFMAILEQCIVEGVLPTDNPLFLDWWTKLKYLIFFCADKDPDYTSEEFLLHAALSNTDTPPNVIRLLLALCSDSARRPDSNAAHPVHLYSMHREYIPRNYESPYMHGLNVMDMLLSVDENAVFHTFQGRLPLHHAVAAGRTWETLHPLIRSHRASLKIPDPITKLYPAFLAAAYQEDPNTENVRYLQLTRNQYSSLVWRGLSDRQQRNAVARIKHFESLKHLDTVFEMLRRYPHCLEAALWIVKDNVDFSQDRFEAGTIASHYLSWCYKKIGEKWLINQENMDILKANIRLAEGRGALTNRSKEFVNWLVMLKLLLWHRCNKDVQSSGQTLAPIPRDDSFILHAAASLADTPPDVMRLLIGLYPNAAYLSLPNTQTLPLHLACKTTKYTPRYFEIAGRYTTIELLVRAAPEVVLMRDDRGRFPLNIAIVAGKTMDELCPLIIHGRTAVGLQDPITRFRPFQLMSASRAQTSDLLLRFQEIARNRHADDWDQFPCKRKNAETERVKKEHQLALLSSVFELLRLDPSALEFPSAIQSSSGGSKDIVLDTPLYRDQKVDVCADGPARQNKNRTQLKRLLSRLSGESNHDGMKSDASAFSSVDMVSTISNVSSHLSFRVRQRSAGIRSEHKSSSYRFSGEFDDESDSGDSDIYSEDMSFLGDYNDDIDEHESNKDGDRDIAKHENNKDGDRDVAIGEYEKNAADRHEWSRDRECAYLEEAEPLKQNQNRNVDSGMEAPLSHGEKTLPAAPALEIPRAINPAGTADDVSILNDNNIDKDSSHRHHIRSATLLSKSDTSSGSGSHSISEGSCSNHKPWNKWQNIRPENVGDSRDLQSKVPGLSTVVNGEARTVDSQGEILEDSSKQSKYRETSKPSLEDVEKTQQISGVVGDGKLEKADKKCNTDDRSVQNETPQESETEKTRVNELTDQREENEKEAIVYFRLRRSSARKSAGLKLQRKKHTGITHNDSSMDMDFLSILNASLPEGKMDFLSTLEASSGSLPEGYDVLPTGRFDPMQQIKEYPLESEQGKDAQERPAQKVSGDESDYKNKGKASSKTRNIDESETVIIQWQRNSTNRKASGSARGGKAGPSGVEILSLAKKATTIGKSPLRPSISQESPVSRRTSPRPPSGDG